LLVELLPHARALPVAQATPARHAGPTPHLLRQVLPGDAGPEHEQNPSKDLSVRNSRPPALGLRGLGRQERLNRRPQLVGYKWCCHNHLYPAEPVLLGTLNINRDGTAPQQELVGAVDLRIDIIPVTILLERKQTGPR